MLHFVDLNHGQRVAAASMLASKPVHCVSVMAWKSDMTDEFRGKNQLYFYLTEHLIEKISWLCRDLRPQTPEGNGQVAVTFSRRGGMSYDMFKDGLEMLRSNEKSSKIHWPVIDIEGIKAVDHSKNASLQLADIIASSFLTAVEHDFYGNCETRYAEILKPTVYNRHGHYFRHGINFRPEITEPLLSDEQKRFINLYLKK